MRLSLNIQLLPLPTLSIWVDTMSEFSSLPFSIYLSRVHQISSRICFSVLTCRVEKQHLENQLCLDVKTFFALIWVQVFFLKKGKTSPQPLEVSKFINSPLSHVPLHPLSLFSLQSSPLCFLFSFSKKEWNDFENRPRKTLPHVLSSSVSSSLSQTV